MSTNQVKKKNLHHFFGKLKNSYGKSFISTANNDCFTRLQKHLQQKKVIA